jgi:hypothetical protein
MGKPLIFAQILDFTPSEALEFPVSEPGFPMTLDMGKLSAKMGTTLRGIQLQGTSNTGYFV